MPNQWKSLFEGITEGGQSFLKGLGIREQKNNASQLYDQTRQTYDKVNQLKSRAGEIIMNMGNLNPVTGFPQVEQKDNTADISKLYGDIQSNYGKLLQNPYGENYVNLLDKFYGQKPTKLETHGDKTYQVNADGTYKVIDSKKEKKKYVLKEVTRDDGKGGYVTKQMWVNENDPNDIKEEGEYSTPKEEEKPVTGRGGFRGGRIKNPMDDMTNKEKQMHSDLEAYRKAKEKGDSAEMNRLGDKFLNQGLNIDEINNEYDYTGKDLKKQTGFLKEKVRNTEQINEAYNETYRQLSMDNWWNDLYGASDLNDFNNRITWYEDYLQKQIFPQVSKEVGAKLWSELQKAKAKIYNDKGFQ